MYFYINFVFMKSKNFSLNKKFFNDYLSKNSIFKSYILQNVMELTELKVPIVPSA